MGEYNSENLLHLKGGSSYIIWRRLPLLSVDKVGKMPMKLTSGFQTESLDNINEAASGHLNQPVGIFHPQ